MKNEKQEYIKIINKIFKWRCHKWLPTYLNNLTRKTRIKKDTHILFLFVDHFEPNFKHGDKKIEDQGIDKWINSYKKLCSKYKDSDGYCPQHSWFYYPELYNNRTLKKLSKLCYEGYGEIEYHLHHSGDTKKSLKKRILKDVRWFNKNGAMITAEQTPKPYYGFIHGMWALDNSIKKYCGVNQEIKVLKKTGCYADFTFPAFGQITQPSKINSIYYAKNTRNPKSYDYGIDVEVRKKKTGDLMIFEGPLSVNSSINVFEYGDMSDYPFDSSRLGAWLDANIHVKGRSEWIFIKVYGHTFQHSLKNKLWENLDKMHLELQKKLKSKKYKLHYVSAREAYNIVKAAEAGYKGNPSDYRDYLIPKPVNKLILSDSLYKLKNYSDKSIILKILENKKTNIEFKNHHIKSLNGKFFYFKNFKNKIKIKGNARIKYK